ncbi:triphosphoribosyl-dephospho-CoA protein [Ferroglobus placidus DSM 10642]|uniref:Triphosphoribosyl-dephospho-CoA protein n=1 Tax=Ferroglobus placidus (strain DSM 10642 / AEDII12DO) TaxID=589924 RepID=D3S009_FERPA|nr:triphosphoribosyl-dephospho-CoA synthase [Ferroglobus placidus]ADC66072.1 triphosphoribosyl-dephospho-CoA protein [Ferroglobus placidus DSM 10642]
METKAALSASIALALEVLATPKSGNVDRFHDFEDLKLHDFVISSICSLPSFLKLARGEIGVGEAIYQAINESVKFHGEKNVHFGAFLLLCPLVSSHGDVKKAVENVKNSDWKQSLYVYKAFKLVNPRVLSSKELDLREDETEKEIVEKKLSLYEWMKKAPEENIVAKELTNGYKLSTECKNRILYWSEKFSLEKAIVLAYHEILSKVPDPLIIAKHGKSLAEKITEEAKLRLKDFKELGNFSIFMEFDEKLIERKINPGSVADIVAAGIYLALMEGVRIA